MTRPPDPYSLVLEFTRAEHAGQPHAFRFAPQVYLLRTAGGGFESAEFPWTPELLDDLREARDPGRSPDTIHRIGETLRGFLAAAGWARHEDAIVRAARDGAAIVVTIRSAAAELYALPWEFVALKSTGQLLGGVPGLLVRYEWPEAPSFPDRVEPPARRGRVLFAWSAAGGAVPAAEHLAALEAAFAGRPGAFDPARDVLAHASFAAIDEALDHAASHGPPIDALHLLCHGAELGGTYGLALDDASAPGTPVAVDAGRMQQLLAAHAGMVRMVVLAACDSGNAGELGNQLGSVAQMIHRAGLQVMIASRYPLSAAGSARFAGSFYRALVRDDAPLERAFVAARDALLRDPSQLDWASVQLYSREADGLRTHPLRLAPASAPAVAEPRSAEAQRPHESPLTPARRWLPFALGLSGLALIGGTLAFSDLFTDAAPPADASPPATVATPPVTTPPASTSDPPTRTSPPREPADDDAPAPTHRDRRRRTAGPCPGKLEAFFANALRDGHTEGTTVDLEISIGLAGRLEVRARGGDQDLLARARERLERSPARLVEDGGGALPCTHRRSWSP